MLDNIPGHAVGGDNFSGAIDNQGAEHKLVNGVGKSIAFYLPDSHLVEKLQCQFDMIDQAADDVSLRSTEISFIRVSGDPQFHNQVGCILGRNINRHDIANTAGFDEVLKKTGVLDGVLLVQVIE